MTILQQSGHERLACSICGLPMHANTFSLCKKCLIYVSNFHAVTRAADFFDSERKTVTKADRPQRRSTRGC
jgi:hypothetical protein